MMPDQNARNLLATAYLVEATGCERHFLWCENAIAARAVDRRDGPRVRWDEISLGLRQTVGHLRKMPVAVSITFGTILGHVVAFHEDVSLVVDHRMIRNWLDRACPNAKGRTNAMNFHNCLLDLERLPQPGLALALSAASSR